MSKGMVKADIMARSRAKRKLRKTMLAIAQNYESLMFPIHAPYSLRLVRDARKRLVDANRQLQELVMDVKEVVDGR